MGTVHIFSKATRQPSPDAGALDSLVRQYGKMFGKNSQGRMELFMRSYKISDRSDINRRLYQIYDNLMEEMESQLRHVPIGRIATAIIYPKGVFEELDMEVVNRIADFEEGFKLVNYPTLHTWDSIRDHPSFSAYSREAQREIREIFYDWQGIVMVATEELQLFASRITAIGFSIEEVVKEGKAPYLEMLAKGPREEAVVPMFKPKEPQA